MSFFLIRFTGISRTFETLNPRFGFPWDFSANCTNLRRFEMGKVLFCFFSGLLLLSVLSPALIESAAGSEMDALGVLWGSNPRPRCEGSIGECFEDDEMQMDSEINRRVLAGRSYISYRALRANSVPCSRRGASYYNCRSTSQANPYRRSCTRITRCARSTSWDSNSGHVTLFLFHYISGSFPSIWSSPSTLYILSLSAIEL